MSSVYRIYDTDKKLWQTRQRFWTEYEHLGCTWTTQEGAMKTGVVDRGIVLIEYETKMVGVTPTMLLAIDTSIFTPVQIAKAKILKIELEKEMLV